MIESKTPSETGHVSTSARSLTKKQAGAGSARKRAPSRHSVITSILTPGLCAELQKTWLPTINRRHGNAITRINRCDWKTCSLYAASTMAYWDLLAAKECAEATRNVHLTFICRSSKTQPSHSLAPSGEVPRPEKRRRPWVSLRADLTRNEKGHASPSAFSVSGFFPAPLLYRHGGKNASR